VARFTRVFGVPTLRVDFVRGMRFRLMLSYVLFFTALLVAVGLFFHQTLQRQTESDVRDALDAVLAEMDYWDVETVAFTIFPERYWELAGGDRVKLFAIYRDAFPRIQAMNPRNNRRGLYFERLTMYGRGPCGGNQLEWIISEHNARTRVRRSKLQATTFDPGRDHVPDAQLGFPCLQHVSFVTTRVGLVVNAFYATQQVFDKAYGNYLGLAQLGAFMAHEMGISLVRLNVNVGVAKLERVTKTDIRLAALIRATRACLRSVEASVPLSDDRCAAPRSAREGHPGTRDPNLAA